jgi:hypothetical protein
MAKSRKAIPDLAHRQRPTRLKFGTPDGGTRSASIARLIRPYEPPLVVASVEHQVLTAGRFYLGIDTVPADQPISTLAARQMSSSESTPATDTIFRR